MDSIKGLPYSTAEFDKEGKLVGEPVVSPGTTDLIVVSHGWNNDREAAESLYRKLFENFVDVTRSDAALASRRVAIVGVIWPAKKFDGSIGADPTGDPAGGALSAGPGRVTAPEEAALHAAIDDAAVLFDDPGDPERVRKLHDLLPKLEDDTQAQAEFVQTLRDLLEPGGDAGQKATREDGENVFFRSSAAGIFEDASKVSISMPVGTSGEPAGDGKAAGLLDMFSKVGKGVGALLNLTTYYEMKKRAGTVGERGLAPLLDRLATQVDRVHLVGHSFGGRLVTAAAKHSTTPKLHSLSLLQAAFSHNGFSKTKQGFFNDVAEGRRVAGPILVTHTKNDTAVGRAYPIASRIAQDDASDLGDRFDRFGAIGSNGAQNMDAAMVAANTNSLLPVGVSYTWQPSSFHNLEATNFIVDPEGGDAHGFVFVPEVAWAISRAVVS